MKTSILKVLWIFSTVISFEAYSINATLLNLGDKAPYQGILLTVPEAEVYKNYKLINDSLEKSLSLEKQNYQVCSEQKSQLLNQNDSLSKSLNSQRSLNDIEKLLWFFGGVLATGFAIYGASKVTK